MGKLMPLSLRLFFLPSSAKFAYADGYSFSGAVDGVVAIVNQFHHMYLGNQDSKTSVLQHIFSYF